MLEAVRLVKAWLSLAVTAKVWGIAKQTPHDWIKANRDGCLAGPGTHSVNPEQMDRAATPRECAAATSAQWMFGHDWLAAQQEQAAWSLAYEIRKPWARSGRCPMAQTD